MTNSLHKFYPDLLHVLSNVKDKSSWLIFSDKLEECGFTDLADVVRAAFTRLNLANTDVYAVYRKYFKCINSPYVTDDELVDNITFFSHDEDEMVHCWRVGAKTGQWEVATRPLGEAEINRDYTRSSRRIYF